MAVNPPLTIVTKTPRFFTGFSRNGAKRPPTCALNMQGVDKRIDCRIVVRKPIEHSGFTPPSGRALGQEQRTVALAEMIAIVSLAVSTVVAATVVSVGIARANMASDVVGNEGGVFGVALLLGLIFLAMGGLTVFTLPGRKPKEH